MMFVLNCLNSMLRALLHIVDQDLQMVDWTQMLQEAKIKMYIKYTILSSLIQFMLLNVIV